MPENKTTPTVFDLITEVGDQVEHIITETRDTVNEKVTKRKAAFKRAYKSKIAQTVSKIKGEMTYLEEIIARVKQGIQGETERKIDKLEGIYAEHKQRLLARVLGELGFTTKTRSRPSNSSTTSPSEVKYYESDYPRRQGNLYGLLPRGNSRERNPRDA